MILTAAAALLATGLSACGRRGAPELPPETTALGETLKKQDAAQAKPGRNGARPAPGVDDSAKQPPAIPGTLGHRPPDQYPFPLDPLL